jgi:crotonobetainyl-CoA:carnitine CoA-transferase CaiB-like acyl-CoA transferase
MREALEDPHARASDILTPVEFPGIGKAPVASTPVKLHGTPGTVRRRAPMLGEHSDEILGELGYSANEIDDLRTSGVV